MRRSRLTYRGLEAKTFHGCIPLSRCRKLSLRSVRAKRRYTWHTTTYRRRMTWYGQMDFFQLHKMGIRGSLWCLLYKSYVNFRCCVRVGGEDSNWYKMECGIHQGGYLSLVKYTAFINSLIDNLQKSDLCSKIYRIRPSPVGYADDLAASTTSENKIDRVMSTVYKHGNDWRYAFNAGKSAVLVFGESKAERKIGSCNRVSKLGG